METEYCLMAIATASILMATQLFVTKSPPKYVIYGTKDCEYTRKLLEHLENEGKMDEFEFKDLTNDDNLEAFDSMGGDSTPCVANPKNSKGIEGFVSYKEIVDGLN